MRFQLHSLERRLSLAYAGGVVLLGGAFVGVSFFFFALVAHASDAALDVVAGRIEKVGFTTIAQAGSVRAAARDLVARTVMPGVRIEIADHHSGSTFRDGEWHSDPPPPGVPAPRPPAPAALPPMSDRRSALYEVISIMLGLQARRLEIAGASIILIPEPGELGFPLIAYFCEMAALSVAVIFLAGKIGGRLTKSALQPIEDVTSALDKIAAGDFTARELRILEQSEIGRLAAAFNAAASSVNAVLSQGEIDRLTMRRFVADAGHELRTPLTVFLGHLEILRSPRERDGDTLARIYLAMEVEAARMRALINNLLTLAMYDEVTVPERQLIKAEEVVREIVASFALGKRSTDFTVAVSGCDLIVAARGELREAIGNVLENALKYAPEPKIIIDIRGDDDKVEILIEDNGPGVSENELPKLFQRFYRGSDVRHREGSGLGLAISAAAVARAAGTMSAENRTGGGLRVRMTFPSAPN